MPQSGYAKPLLFFFHVAAFPGGALALFLALGALGGALDQLRADQLDHGLFGTVALARAQAHDPGVAAVALAETRGQGVEQLLDRSGREEHPGGFAAGVQRVRLAQRDHAVHQRLGGLGLGHGGDDALLLDHVGDQSPQQGFAGRSVPLQLISGYSMSLGLTLMLRGDRPGGLSYYNWS